MRALFDLQHPAQVHFFKHAIRALREDGSDLMVTARDKDRTCDLLASLGIPSVRVSRARRGLGPMAIELAQRTARIARLARRFRPDVMVAKTGISTSMAGRLLGIPSIVFDDTEFAWLQVALSAPFATVVCTGAGYGRSFGRKQLHYDAVPHMVYTHPARFRPDADVLRRHGIAPEEPYVAMRVKRWQAAHDAGVRGASNDDIRRIADALRPFGRVVLTTERPLPRDLAALVNPLPMGSSLHLLAFARLYVGEGSSMAAEAACLGTPAVYLSPRSRRGYLDFMERRYGHVRTVRDVPTAIEVCKAWLSSPEAKARAAIARERMAREQPDPLEFMLNVIRSYGGANARRSPTEHAQVQSSG